MARYVPVAYVMAVMPSSAAMAMSYFAVFRVVLSRCTVTAAAVIDVSIAVKSSM